MKFRRNSDYELILCYALSFSVLGAVIVALVFNLSAVGDVLNKIKTVFNPIVIGFIIAYLCNPFMKKLEMLFTRFFEKKQEHPKAKRITAIIVTYIVYIALITLLLVLVIPQIGSSCNDLVAQLPAYIQRAEELLTKISDKIPVFDADKISSLADKILEASTSIAADVAPHLTSAVSSFMGYAKNGLLGVILSIYFLISKEKIALQLKAILYALLRRDRADSFLQFIKHTDNIFGGFIIGKIVDSAIIGVLTFVVLLVCRIPYPVLVAVIVGITNIIPFFGPIIGAVPSAFVILIADPIKAVWFVIAIVIIQQLDGNVIGPKILGQSTGVSSLGVIIAITVMGGFMGILGMFIGVPVFALLGTLAQKAISFIESRRKAADNGEAQEDDENA